MKADVISEADAAASVTFEEWLGKRRPVHLSTNSGTDLVAFQSWRNFKEAFAPELIAQAFEETANALGRAITDVIDPFGGSGTTALSSQFLAAKPCTIEVNPYLADLIEAKLATYDLISLRRDFERVVASFAPFSAADCFPGAPKTFVEPGVRGRYLYSTEMAANLAGLKEAIKKVRSLTNRRLLRVVLASIAVPLSNVVISGKGRRYRRGWETRQPHPDAALAMFEHSFEQAFSDISRYRKRLCLSYDLKRGDCRTSIPTDKKFDIAIFSPPYPNSFDYTDVYNVELWTAGYLSASKDNSSLRKKTLRSHVQISRSFAVANLQSPTLARVRRELEGVRASLWNKNIPDMVAAYFDDMNIVMGRLADVLVPRGRAYLVIGDSRYQGVNVPVADILIELSEVLGFTKISEEPFRSMRASPQQGGRKELVETLLVLEKI